jgi:hypothetical protein
MTKMVVPVSLGFVKVRRPVAAAAAAEGLSVPITYILHPTKNKSPRLPASSFPHHWLAEVLGNPTTLDKLLTAM